MLKKSSHAHTNSFGILHTLFGLTQPYSTLSLKTKAWQTCGLLAGSFTMSFLLFTRSLSLLDQASYDALGWVIGAFLSATLLALASHSFGLLAKFLKR